MFEAAGVRGQVRVGHRVALTLGQWSLRQQRDQIGDVRATVQATVVDRDEFWSAQGPQDLYLDMGRAWWRWRHVVVIGEGSVSLTVRGDPEIMEGL
jgi:hypothetical protein